MKEKYLPNKKYYKFSPDFTYGIVFNEGTMSEIVKIIHKAEAEIKHILHNAEDVRPISWSFVTIAQGDKIIKQREFYYEEVDSSWLVDMIDDLSLTAPKYVDNFYEIHNDKELKELKKELKKELQKELKKRRD